MGLDDAAGLSWPAVIAGAGFAGLAVASEVHEEVALLDRFPVGSHRTSACATFVSTLEDFGLRCAVLRTFDSIVLHVPRPLRIEPIDPLCTFDFGVLCRELFAQGRSTFFRTDARGVVGHTVRTGLGALASSLLVDATGWSARLGSSLDPSLVDPRRLTFGIETHVGIEEDTMHERRLMRVIVQSRGDVLQRDLVTTTAFSDAKVSRLLDRLEERGLVVRERQGMTNRVRLLLRQK